MPYSVSPEFHSRRSMVIAPRGMVATSHPLAAQAGLNILRQGGNAADAAIATAAVLAVVEPAATGLGGDCFALFYDGGNITGLNGSGRAPAALTPDLFGTATEIPERHPLAVTVAGTVRGWEDLLAKHGRMNLKVVLTDAIFYALNGFPVSPMFGAAWERLEPLLKNSPNAEEYLPAPKIGELKKLPSLGRTLQAIAEGGSAAFYEGKTAQAMVQTLAELGGVMTLDDLKKHTSTWVEPIFTDYRGVRVFEIPPNGQGLAALQALNILEGFDLGSMAWDDPARLHLMIEAMRLAFADAKYYIADPEFNPAPLAGLLSKKYAAERRQFISPDFAMQPPSFGYPPKGSDTVYLSVVDGEGNACSFINSLYMGFGSGIVAKGTGVFLQNRGANFSLIPDHPNVVAPNKRPYHTIIPAMATQSGALWASFGVMGGFMQPQGHVQVLTAMLDDGLDPQAALDRPRWMVMDEPVIALEEGIPLKTMARLAEMGHPVRPMTGFNRAYFGSGQIIRHENGVLFGGSDPRKDGLVAAF